MSETADIRRHANGSIDIEHYAKIGKGLHAQAIREAGRYLVARFREIFVAMSLRLLGAPKNAGGSFEFAPLSDPRPGKMLNGHRRQDLVGTPIPPYSSSSSSMGMRGMSAGGMG